MPFRNARGAPVGIYDTSQQAAPGLIRVIQGKANEIIQRSGTPGQIKFCADIGAIRSRSDRICRCAIAQNKPESAEQNRLASTGFTSNDGQSGPELYFEGLDQREVSDGQ